MILQAYLDILKSLDIFHFILRTAYKKPTRGIIVTEDLEINNNCPDSCGCLSSKYKYEPCGHVII